MPGRTRDAGGSRTGDAALDVRLLGGLELLRDGQALGLDLSRKTRALLGYLVARGHPERRQALCELFWQGPDDPRGSLRWSLSRIRKALGDEAARVQVDGDRVAISAVGAHVDWHAARALVGASAEAATTADLQAAAALLRGELLAGLELDDCFGYQAWCLAEREAARKLRLAVLATLVGRLAGEPERALSHARAWVTADPLAEPAHAALMCMLVALGRQREALEQYGLCRRILEAELGTSPSGEVEMLRMNLRAPARPEPAAASAPAVAEVVQPAPDDRPVTVGRGAEQEIIAARLARAERGEAGAVLLITGEPGIGKTHLLAQVGGKVRAGGGRVLHGRAYEAETGRAFGPWTEALGGGAEVGPPFPAVMERLLPAGAREVTALLLDDLQWADEASIALLHFTVRTLGNDHRLVLVLAARPGDLAENRPAAGLVRALRRDQRLTELTLGPLAEAEVLALATAAHPTVDANRVVAHSDGNPLFALEVARALERGDAELSSTLEHVIAGHLERLGPLTQAVLPWTAALGRSFEVALLPRLCPWPAPDLLAALEELERQGVLRSLPGGHDGAGAGYDFTHDLYRQAAYRRLSGPRRRLVHAQIAGALAALDDPAGAWAAELARHAALGGAPLLAARACLAAGARCQRLLAPGEAATFCDRGLSHLGGAAEATTATTVALRMALLRLKVHSGAARGDAAAAGTEAALLATISAADASGLLAEVASGYHALSVLHQQRGQLDRARQDTLRAEAVVRAADAATAARQQANTARCLAQLERDIGRARQLARDARALADRFELDEVELLWAEGLLERWDGRDGEAAAALERAVALAASQQDRQREHGAQLGLIMLDLERGRAAAVRQRCQALAPLSRKLGPTETAQVEALAALAAAVAGEPGALQRVDHALADLRTLDCKAQVAYALATASEIAFGQGATALAARLAAEGQAAAELMELSNEAALSAAVLARVAVAQGDAARARRHLQPVLAGTLAGESRSARCRRVIAAAVRELEPSPAAGDKMEGGA